MFYQLKSVYRNFINQKPYSFLNLIGLSIGLAISFIALLYITQETGYDTFHKNSKNIYRLISQNPNSPVLLTASNTAFDGLELQEEAPVIKQVVRYRNFTRKINEKYSSGGIYADPSFYEVFTMDFLQGNPKIFATDDLAMSVSEAFALEEFGTVDVVGKTLEVEDRNKNTFTIQAVYKNFPEKSTLKPKFILPIKQEIRPKIPNVWISAYYTFFLLENNADINRLNEEISSENLELQALEDIHLYSEDIAGVENKGSIKILISYTIIGSLILLISIMNYLLLYTAILNKRIKEFAIRKVNGLGKIGLFKLLVLESSVICFTAAVIAILMVKMLLPIFNNFTQSTIKFNWVDNGAFFIYALALVIMVTLLSGIRLYYYLLRYSVIEFLNKTKTDFKSSFIVKNNTILLQLIIVSFMLVFSIGYYKQLDFLLNSDKGYNPDNKFALGSLAINIDVFKEEAKKYTEIKEVAMGNVLPNMRGSAIYTINTLDNPSNVQKMEYFGIDYNYIPLYDIEIIEGRNFSKAYATDVKNAVILNETGMKALEIKQPIGTRTSLGTVIGVVKDFNFETLHNTIRPMVFKLYNKENDANFMVVSYDPNKKQEAEAAVINLLVEQNPSLANAFDPTYTNLEIINYLGSMEAYRKTMFDPDYVETVNEHYYGKERIFQKTILLLTAIAIFVTILGLIGMSLFKSQQRTKEIGIRKVNGATISEIVLMLNKDIVKWTLVAFILATPLAYYAINKWLENFAYKTELSWWIFALACLFTLIIALLTVSWQTYKAATRNPVESLRDE